MPGSTKSFRFPDINVWMALTYTGHVHHQVAWDWFESISPDSRLYFCRFTQLGLLRLLTAEAVMRDEVMNQPEAWATYDRWRKDERVDYLDEPSDLEHHFRPLTRMRQPAPKDWADAYLAAFATATQLVLVTFDRGFRTRTTSLELLSDQ